MKRKTQKIFVALAVMLMLTFGASAAYGQDTEARETYDSSIGNGDSIVGTWVATVTIRNCQTGVPIRSFPVLNTFNRGGTMMETSRSLTTRSPGHGTWQRISGDQYYSVFMFFRSNADGTDNGFQKVRRYHTLSYGASSLTTQANFENFDAVGNLVSTGCATETATPLSFR